MADHLTAYVQVGWQRTADTPFNGIPVYHDGVLPKIPYDYFVGGSDFEAVGEDRNQSAGGLR